MLNEKLMKALDKEKASGPAINGYFAAFSLNGKIYAGTAGQGYERYYFWEYDPITDKWTKKKDFPGETIEGNLYFVVDNKAYVIDRNTASAYNNELEQPYSGYLPVWEYNPIEDNWIRKADCPYNMYYTRYPDFAFSINNKGYMGSSTDGRMYEYNPVTDTWKQCTNFPTSVLKATYSSTEQYGFVVGGFISWEEHYNPIISSICSDFFIYNPATDEWTKKANCPIEIGNGIGFCKDGYIYAGLGSISKMGHSSERDNRIFKYDNVSNSWSLAIETPSLLLSSSVGVMCNGKLYIIQNQGAPSWEYAF